MIIRSRPEEELVEIGYADAYQLHLSQEELFLISALVCHCRLGQPSIYSTAAYNLISKIEAVIGDDGTSDACDDVALQATIEDANGMVVMETDSNHYITLEV